MQQTIRVQTNVSPDVIANCVLALHQQTGKLPSSIYELTRMSLELLASQARPAAKSNDVPILLQRFVKGGITHIQPGQQSILPARATADLQEAAERASQLAREMLSNSGVPEGGTANDEKTHNEL